MYCFGLNVLILRFGGLIGFETSLTYGLCLNTTNGGFLT